MPILSAQVEGNDLGLGEVSRRRSPSTVRASNNRQLQEWYSETTSLDPSTLEFVEEHGRTYHSYKLGNMYDV